MSQSTDIWPEIWALKRKVGALTGEDEPTYVYAPYSLSVYGGYRSIHISWEHKNSSKAIRTEIWTSTTPVREEASMVGRVEGQTFAVHDLEPLQLWHVWIRTVNVAIEDGGEFTQVSDWVGPETAITKAVELEDEHVVATLDAQARALGFSPQTQTLEVHGLCAECARK